MPVRYVRVNATSSLFSPATRAFGNVAIIGDASLGNVASPVLLTDPDTAVTTFRDPSTTGDPADLAHSIKTLFAQSPGPSLVYGVRAKNSSGTIDWTGALSAVSALDVQLVVLANTPLNATSGGTGGAIAALVSHVTSVSNTLGDGQERMGVAMLETGKTDTSVVTGALAEERMVYVAHKSTEDAAAAVAGTIAGYPPYVSLVLKQVNINNDAFTPAEIDTINGSETDASGPAAKNGVNWLAHPVLIPGRGVYLGEGYTGNPGKGKPYIDIVRTLDDISFRLKAQLISAIGSVRISRSGLRAVVAQMEAVLDPIVAQGVLNDYSIVVPLLAILDKDPLARTPSEASQLTTAEAQRLVQVLIAVHYAAAIHRLTINLNFS